MGYRSDVGYKIQFDNWIEWQPTITDRPITSKDLFNTFLAEAKSREDTKLCFEDDDGVFTIDEDKLSITFYANSVKWYEDYPDVKCHEALLDLANEWIEQHEKDDRLRHSPVRWGFVRIGEEQGDVDERHNNEGYELVYTCRSIEFG